MNVEERVEITEKDKYYLIKLYGKFVGEDETEYLEKKLESFAKTKLNNVIIDFSEVTYFSSIAIGILLKMDDLYTKYNGKIILTNIPEVISNILSITKVARILNIARNLDEAEYLINR